MKFAVAIAMVLGMSSTALAVPTEVDTQKLAMLAIESSIEIKGQRIKKPEPEPEPVVEEESDAAPVWTPPENVGPINWIAIAQCESGGNWSVDSTYDGGLQFHPDTWIAAGGGQYAPYAYMATPDQQIATAQRWADMIGCVQCRAGWPNCGRYAYT